VHLLGVNWGQIYEKRPLRDKDGKEIEGPHVTEASGMNGVVPAWHILSLLEQDDVRGAIKKIEEKEVARLGKSRAVIEASAADEPITDDTKDRLEAILRGAFAGPPTPLKDIPTKDGEPRAKRKA
jgi:hypothetical protein